MRPWCWIRAVTNGLTRCLPVIGSRSRYSPTWVWRPSRTWTEDSLPIYTKTCSFSRFRTTVTDVGCWSRRLSLGLKNNTSSITNYVLLCENNRYLHLIIRWTDTRSLSTPLLADNVYRFESAEVSLFITNVVEWSSVVTTYFPSVFMIPSVSSVLLNGTHEKCNVIAFTKID